jgi:hypothetical protein
MVESIQDSEFEDNKIKIKPKKTVNKDNIIGIQISD